jgi:hypothetical protein
MYRRSIFPAIVQSTASMTMMVHGNLKWTAGNSSEEEKAKQAKQTLSSDLGLRGKADFLQPHEPV